MVGASRYESAAALQAGAPPTIRPMYPSNVCSSVRAYCGGVNPFFPKGGWAPGQRVVAGRTSSVCPGTSPNSASKFGRRGFRPHAVSAADAASAIVSGMYALYSLETRAANEAMDLLAAQART